MHKDRFKGLNSGRSMIVLVGILAIIALGAVLKLTSSVLVPLVVAALLSFVFDPIVSFLERLRIPRVLGIAAVVLLLLTAIFLVGLLIFSSGKQLISVIPKYEQRLSLIYSQLAKFFSLSYDASKTFFGNLLGDLRVRSRIQSFTFSWSETFLAILGRIVLVIVFMVFLMGERVHFKDKLLAAFEDRISEKIRGAASRIIAQVVRYLSVKFFISLLTGVLVYGAFLAIGMEFALIWAVLAFVFNFIPNIGSIFVGVASSLFALLQFWPAPGPVVAVAATMLLVNLSLGYFVEPKVQGDSLDLSPFVVLFSLLVWGWLWGFMGLVLAVPMTALIKIVCENIPLLEPVALIMGSYRAVKERQEQENAAAAGAAASGAAGAASDSASDPESRT